MTPYTHGACRDENPEAFFPDASDHVAIRAAKVICHGCPVQAECLELAMGNEFGSKSSRDGIYGGTTATERASMYKRTQRPINHGTEGGYKTHQRRGESPCSSCIEGSAVANRERDARKRSAA